MNNSICCPDNIINACAERLKACGHPVRLKILCLIEKENSCVNDLWRCLNQSQPVISQHLAALKNKGIVKSETEGNRRIYSIADPFIKKIINCLDEMNIN